MQLGIVAILKHDQRVTINAVQLNREVRHNSSQLQVTNI